MSTRTTTPAFTASFPALFEATGSPGFDPKFSVTMIWDKAEDLSKLKGVCQAAINKKWGDNPPANIQLPMKDGDGKLDKDGKQRPEFEGKKFAVAKANPDSPPKVVDVNLNPILDKSEIYGGCKLRAAVSAYAWEFAGKNGVSLYLGNVQKVGDGEAFGTASSVEDDFGAAPF